METASEQGEATNGLNFFRLRRLVIASESSDFSTKQLQCASAFHSALKISNLLSGKPSNDHCLNEDLAIVKNIWADDWIR